MLCAQPRDVRREGGEQLVARPIGFAGGRRVRPARRRRGGAKAVGEGADPQQSATGQVSVYGGGVRPTERRLTLPACVAATTLSPPAA